MASDSLLEQALDYMERGPFSVTHKSEPLLIDDRHEYVSGRLYWWEEDGKFVKRDGQPNPATQGPQYDRSRLGEFIRSVTTLSYAYQESGRQEFATKAAELVQVWFVDPETRMNPCLEHAQVLPGHRAQGHGIIDTYDFYYLLDALELLVTDGIINTTLHSRLQEWFRQLATWMRTSQPGKMERKRNNNHGTSYDVQLVRYLLFCGQNWRAKWHLQRCGRRRIVTQIEPDGRQPFEQRRSKSLFYHWYNLTKLLHLCELGARVGLDLIHYRNRIKIAIEYLAPYLQCPDDWPFEQIAPLEINTTVEPVFIGGELFGNEECRQFMADHTHLFDEHGRCFLRSFRSLLPSQFEPVVGGKIG